MPLQCEAEALAQVIRSVVRDQVKGLGSAGLMFSGGLDSAIIAVSARKFCHLTLYTAGAEGSRDLEWGLECAATLDLPIVPIILEREAVLESLKTVRDVHDIDNPKWVTTFIGFDMVLKHVAQKAVLCGQGADELFGGYRKYRDAPEAEAIMRHDYDGLVMLEFPAYRKVAAYYGRELLSPYLDTRISDLAGSLDLRHKIGGIENKLVLRSAAEFLGVPGAMACRQKTAMQYGSGISKIVKAHLKSQRLQQ